MAFSDLTSNQMVRFTDANSSGIPLKPGKSHIISNEMMTKAQALDLYNLDPSYLTGYSSNQLIPKSVWVENILYYEFTNQWVPADTYAETCSLAMETSFMWYTTNSNGQVSIGDKIYYYLEGFYIEYISDWRYYSYVKDGVRGKLDINQTTAIIEQKANCLSDNEINVYKSFLGNPVGGDVELTAIATEGVTSSVLTITYLATGSISGNSQNLTVEISIGNTYGNSTTPLSGFSSLDDITFTLVNWAPTEDSTYNYIVIDN